MSTESNAKIFSVIGGCRRSGRWLVPAETSMLTLFGRAVIDLREARTSAEELAFTCTSVFANITFIVPEGAEVRPSGIAILGSSRSTVPVSDLTCELPPISVEALTVFGRMRIRTTEETPDDDLSRRERRRRRKAEKARAKHAKKAATSPEDQHLVDPEPARFAGVHADRVDLAPAPSPALRDASGPERGIDLAPTPSHARPEPPTPKVDLDDIPGRLEEPPGPPTGPDRGVELADTAAEMPHAADETTDRGVELADTPARADGVAPPDAEDTAATSPIHQVDVPDSLEHTVLASDSTSAPDPG